MLRPVGRSLGAVCVATGVCLLAECGANRSDPEPAESVDSIIEECVTAHLLQLPETEREKLRSERAEGVFLHIYFSPSFLLCDLSDGSEAARTFARHGVKSLDGRVYAVALGLQRRLKGQAPDVLDNLRRASEVERPIPVAR